MRKTIVYMEWAAIRRVVLIADDEFPRDLLESGYDQDEQFRLSAEQAEWVFQRGLEGEKRQLVLALRLKLLTGCRIGEVQGFLVGQFVKVDNYGLPLLGTDETTATTCKIVRQWLDE